MYTLLLSRVNVSEEKMCFCLANIHFSIYRPDFKFILFMCFIFFLKGLYNMYLVMFNILDRNIFLMQFFIKDVHFTVFNDCFKKYFTRKFETIAWIFCYTCSCYCIPSKSIQSTALKAEICETSSTKTVHTTW